MRLQNRLMTSVLWGVLLGVPLASGQTLPPLASHLDPTETAILLVDFQNNFASPDGEHYPRYQKVFEETGMLENSVDLVKRARALGIQVIQVMEGYTADYRQLDWSNPGWFHRSQIARKAWVRGTPRVALYGPMQPGPNDRDILLPNRITVSGFGGNGLDTILKWRGIKNIALGGFSTDGCVYATLLSAYDLGYHVYALQDAMATAATELGDMLLRRSYPKYSRVIGYEEFLQMVEKFPTPQEN